MDFNIEQQAAIVEDWWRVTKSLPTINNIGTDKSLATYNNFIDQVRGAGPPHKPAIPPIPRFRH